MSDTTNTRPPIASAPLSLVLIAGSARDLPDVVAGWVSYLTGLNRTFEIILADEGNSGDWTAFSELGGDQPFVRVLTSDGPRGPGGALAAGIAAAQHPLLGYAPADRQFAPADLQRLLDQIDQVDLVTGYRVAGPIPFWLRAWDGLRRLSVRILMGEFPARRESWLGHPGWRRRWLARWAFGLRVQDPECPLRLFRREVFRRIPIQSHGPFVHMEILAKANHLGAMMSEAAVTWTPPEVPPGQEDRTRWRKEFFELFRRPDFGPVHADVTAPIRVRSEEPPPVAV